MVGKSTIVLMDADFSFLSGKVILNGGITQTQALQVLEGLSKKSQDTESCANCIYARYIQEFGLRNDKKSKSSNSTLELDIRLRNMKCCDNVAVTNKREDTITCAKNIRAGKCVDKNVRETIGVILFPELYAKDTQKQK